NRVGGTTAVWRLTRRPNEKLPCRRQPAGQGLTNSKAHCANSRRGASKPVGLRAAHIHSSRLSYSAPFTYRYDLWVFSFCCTLLPPPPSTSASLAAHTPVQ
ncbi:unnamed protein product, partial [Ectocarpus fasciculatus]